MSMMNNGTTRDAIYWSEERTSGSVLFKLPLTGGRPQVVPGSQGFRVVSHMFPWVTTQNALGANHQGTIWNVATGERRSWTVHDNALRAFCDPIACNGSTSDRVTMTHELDGTGYQELPRIRIDYSDGRFAGGTIAASSNTPRGISVGQRNRQSGPHG